MIAVVNIVGGSISACFESYFVITGRRHAIYEHVCLTSPTSFHILSVSYFVEVHGGCGESRGSRGCEKWCFYTCMGGAGTVTDVLISSHLSSVQLSSAQHSSVECLSVLFQYLSPPSPGRSTSRKTTLFQHPPAASDR